MLGWTKLTLCSNKRKYLFSSYRRWDYKMIYKFRHLSGAEHVQTLIWRWTCSDTYLPLNMFRHLSGAEHVQTLIWRWTCSDTYLALNTGHHVVFNLSHFLNACFNLCRWALLQVATQYLYQMPSFGQVSSKDPNNLHGFTTEGADLRSDARWDLHYFFDCRDNWGKTAAQLFGGVV